MKAVKVDLSKPPLIPILPPTYTTPAPKLTKLAVMSPLTIPSLEDIDELSNSNNDIHILIIQLDKRLSYYSYISGFQPSAIDMKVFVLVKNYLEVLTTNVTNTNINVLRWKRSIESFTNEQQLAWI